MELRLASKSVSDDALATKRVRRTEWAEMDGVNADALNQHCDAVVVARRIIPMVVADAVKWKDSCMLPFSWLVGL